MGNPKGMVPPRYDQAFKDGAVKLVVEQGRSSKDVARELGVSPDSMRNWLKAAGTLPKVAERVGREAKRIRELEARLKQLEKQLVEKDETITVLKKSVGILLGALEDKYRFIQANLHGSPRTSYAASSKSPGARTTNGCAACRASAYCRTGASGANCSGCTGRTPRWGLTRCTRW